MPAFQGVLTDAEIRAVIGFIIASAGAIMGPHWALVIAGGALVLIAGLVAMVMKAMGYGQP